jgi:branched-chain amino acid transport system substrate-binding protein
MPIIGHYRRQVRVAVLAFAALAVAACGTQVDHGRIVAAAGTATEQTDGDLAAPSSGGSPTRSSEGGSGTQDTSGGTPTGSATTGGSAAGPTASTTPGAATTGTRQANLSPVVIGNIGSYSGVLGSIFPAGGAGVQAWAQDVNTRGGLNGHPVQVVSGDDGGDPARALSLARRMVEEQGAIGFLGNMMPLSLSGIRPYLEQNNIPLVGGDMTLPDWSDSPVMFPSGTDIRSISKGILLLLAENADRLYMVFCGESPSCGALAAAAQGTPPPGIELVAAPRQISIVQTDFTTECLEAKSKRADVLFVSADAGTVLRVARSCAAQDYFPLYSTASIAVGFQLAGDPSMEGLIAPINNVPWFDTSTPGGARYVRAMQTYASGVNPDAPSMSQFASGLVVEAATKSLSANPTSAELLSALRNNIRNETALGTTPPMTFRNGPIGLVKCYFVVQVRGGKWTAPNGTTPSCVP